MTDEFARGVATNQNRISTQATRELFPKQLTAKPKAIARYTGEDKALTDVVNAMRNNIESLQGTRGDPKASAVSRGVYDDEKLILNNRVLKLEKAVRLLEARIVVLEP